MSQSPSSHDAPHATAHTQQPPLASAIGESLSSMLKHGTQAQHDAAEQHAFHAMLFGGEGAVRAREAYVRSLGQHLHLQETFEPLLRKAADLSPAFRAMVRPYHFHLDGLRDDLQVLGATGEQTSVLGATSRFASFIQSSAAHVCGGLLGVWYVFEGSTNGGTIIAKRVRDLLGLPEDRGTRFTNPHGSLVRARWAEWKQTLDALEFDESQRQAMVDAASTTFRSVGEVMGEVHRAMDRNVGP